MSLFGVGYCQIIYMLSLFICEWIVFVYLWVIYIKSLPKGWIKHFELNWVSNSNSKKIKNKKSHLDTSETHNITQSSFISSSPVHSRLESLHCVQVDVPIVTPDCEHSPHDSGNPDSPTWSGQLRHVLPAVHSRVKALYRAQGWIVIKTTFRKETKIIKKSTTSVCLGIFSDGFVKKLKGQQETGMYEITSHEIIKTYVIWQATHSGIKTTYCFEQDYAVTNGAGTT